jgi:hypothetical protein
VGIFAKQIAGGAAGFRVRLGALIRAGGTYMGTLEGPTIQAAKGALAVMLTGNWGGGTQVGAGFPAMLSGVGCRMGGGERIRRGTGSAAGEGGQAWSSGGGWGLGSGRCQVQRDSWHTG